MTALFGGGGGDAPAPPKPIVPAPTMSSAEVQAAAEAERARRAGAFGRRSTILTAPSDTRQGDAKPTLLGAA